MSKNPPKPIEVFFSYAHEDEDLRDELEKHLSILRWQGVITGWHDRRIGAGREWKGEIDTHLNTADVILLLISADFLASGYCYDVEMKRAMERHEAGEACVIPIILRPVDWKGATFGKLQALPTDAKPVTEWPNRDGAFLNVAQGIRAAVEELVGPSKVPTQPPIQESPLAEPWMPTTLEQPRRGCYAEYGRMLKFAILLLVPLVIGGILMWSGGGPLSTIIAMLSTAPTPTVQALATRVPSSTSTPSPTSAVPTDTPYPTYTPLPTNTPIPSPPPGMVDVPAGEFIMGSSDQGETNEKPVHTVYLDDFYIDRTEVTNAQYRECVEVRACNTPSDTTDYNNADYAQHPVVYVDWNQANAYCQWAGKRLPTEAEWEKAARGTNGRTYPWDAGIDCDHAQYEECSGETVPVGSKRGASPYGALDMAGNVWEWVADWYGKDYYSQSPTQNPTGPDSGEKRVLRGGSWSNDQWVVRCTYRKGEDPRLRGSSVGFRCAWGSQ